MSVITMEQIGRILQSLQGFEGLMGEGDTQPWPLHLLHILFGYALVVVPAWLLIRYVRAHAEKFSDGALDRAACWRRWAKAFALGIPEYVLVDGGGGTPVGKRVDEVGSGGRRGLLRDCGLLLIMFTGIQTTLVAMGYLQERVITSPYKAVGDAEKFDRFGDAQFLVFCNRIVALAICAVVLTISWAKQPPHVPPYYKHAYTSFSNTISSWCQYEALKYVSFPTQTICKASKVVATMMMGTVVRGQRYSLAEYACGGGIAIGASLFLLAAPDSGIGSHAENATTISGIVLMLGYLVFDAFTLNWQKALFDTRPKVSKYQMMLGVNFFSAVLCLVSLWEQGSLVESIGFALTHEGFTRDAFLLSLSGAMGQLFIYSTIERFGPIVFAVIMTIRQMISIVVSTISYGHPMSPLAVLGFCVVFGCIFLDINRRYFERARK